MNKNLFNINNFIGGCIMFIKAVVVENNKKTSLVFPLGHPLSEVYEEDILNKGPVFVYKIDGSDHQLDILSWNVDLILSTWCEDFPNRVKYELWECEVENIKQTNFDTIGVNELISKAGEINNEIKDGIISNIIDDGSKKVMVSTVYEEGSLLYDFRNYVIHNYDPYSKIALGGIKLVRLIEEGNCVTKEINRY